MAKPSNYILVGVAILLIAIAAVALVATSPGKGRSGYTTITTPTTTRTTYPSTTTISQNATCSNVAQFNLTVPVAWQNLYTELSANLDNFSATMTGPQPNQNTTFGAELIAADSNRGVALLQPYVLQDVINELNAFNAIGIKGVTVGIGFPIMLPGFNNSQKYVNFYQNVSQQIHKRGMKMIVEYHLIFINTPFSSLAYNYANLTYQQFLQQRQQMAQALISNIHPDVIDMGSEPETMYSLIKGGGADYRQILTPAGWYNFTLGSLTGVNLSTTKIAAGLGSWDNPNVIKYILNDSKVDYLTLHIYPIQPINQQYIAADGQLSQKYSKPIYIDEAWEWKNTATNVFAAVAVNESLRGPWSFWIPIDQKFLSAILKYSRIYNVQYISPFHIQSFYAYLDYQTTIGDTQAQETTALNQETSPNLNSGVLSPTGCTYKTLIAGH